ncbi:MAG TPA: hypothetical protein VN665_01335 [Candidatus Paceibacterota bacterium]|nr:hypothetical protein [Candidatus Paceibacterota bacterium]
MDDDFENLIPKRTDGKITPLPRIDRPLRNTESFADALQHLRDVGLGPDLDKAIRKRGIDPTLPAEEIQKQLRDRAKK